MFTPGASKILSIDASTVTAYVHFVFVNTSSVGRGLRLTHIACSQIETSNRRIRNAGVMIPVLGTITGHSNPYLVLVDVSRAGYGGGLP